MVCASGSFPNPQLWLFSDKRVSSRTLHIPFIKHYISIIRKRPLLKAQSMSLKLASHFEAARVWWLEYNEEKLP